MTTVAAQRQKARTLRHRLLHHRALGQPARRLYKAYHRALHELAVLVRKQRKSIPQKAVREAHRHLGETENPPGSNHISFAVEFGIDGEPWCGAFVGHCLRAAGVSVPRAIVYTPNIPHLEGWTIVATPRAGDLALYDFPDKTQGIEHVGLVINAKTLETIEGNTSFDDGGSQDNGGAVAHKHRHGQYVVCWVRPPYPTA